MKKHWLITAALLLFLCGCSAYQEGGAASGHAGPAADIPPSSSEDDFITAVSTTLPSSATVPPTTVTPSVTTAPPATTMPPVTTTPPSNGNEMIGSLYTRSELQAMDKTLYGCGSGYQRDAKNRPQHALDMQARFEKYNAHFIGEDDNSIYLTFDCGYEHENLTAVILDILKKKNVQCVFFVDLYFAKSNPILIQRIISEGHILGNHGASHCTMPSVNLDTMADEIMRLHDFIAQTYGYTMNLYRPASGYYSEQVLAVAQSLGYTTVNYDFAYKDWETGNQPDPQTSYRHVLDNAHSGGIYLLHAVSSTNAAILGNVIDQFRLLGFDIKLFQ